MFPLLYVSGSWWSTLEVKSLSLNASPTIWQWLMKVNSGNEITVLECLLYYMTMTHEGQHWKWNHWPWMPSLLCDRGSGRLTLEVKSCIWMPPLLYDSGSWISTLEMKLLTLNASPSIWQWLMKVNTGSEITVLEFSSTIWQSLMKVNNGSEINVLECLPYYMTEAQEGQHWKWNHCP